MKKLLLLLFVLAGISSVAAAQVPVAAPPWFKQQYFKSTGVPNAFGCIFTYISGSSTPLATYTDYVGNVANSNPIDLDAGGFAGTSGTGMWLQAGTAYRITLKTSGGSHCASGSTIWSMDGVGGGVTLNTTTVTYSATPTFPIVAQNQLFEITLTGNAVAQPLTAVGIIPPSWVAFQITQDGAGGHTFAWPSNSVGGCTIGATAGQVTTQFFVWNGSTATATGPCVTGNGPSISTGDISVAGAITATGRITGSGFSSTCANVASAGTIRLCKTDNILWRNEANGADQGISQDSSNRGVWSFAGGLETTGAVPDIFLGGTTASFPRLKRSSTAINFRLGDDSADAPITASTVGASGVITSTSATYALGGAVLSDPGAAAASTMRGYFKTGFGWCAEDSGSVVYCTSKSNVAGLQILSATGPYTCSGDQTVCAFTLTWPTAWADTNYTAVCDPSGPSETSGSTSLANGGHGNQTTTTIDVYAVSSGSSSKTYAKWVCYGIHD